MAPQVPQYEPAQITAGDTIQWTREFPDYKSADGWALSYAFRGEKGDGKLDLTSQPDQMGYLTTITGAQSGAMRPGVWKWEAYITLGSQRTTVGRGSTTVTPNLAVIDSSQDLRTTAKKNYDNAMEALANFRLGKTVSLNGRVYTQHDVDDLITYVDYCTNQWKLEEAGQTTGPDHPAGDPRKIYVRLMPHI